MAKNDHHHSRIGELDRISPAESDSGPSGHDKHKGHSPEMFRDRLWVSLLLTGPILYFSEQIQEWFGYQAVEFAGSTWVTPVLATVLFVYAGSVFLRGAFDELRHRQPGMMTLIAMAISVAYLYSLAVSIGLDGKPFYWELATLLDVMLLGHWMEMRSVENASRALDHLASMIPDLAHRLLDDGSIDDVPAGELTEGDKIIIRPGEQVATDGVIVEGASSMNEAFLTGESRPIAKSAGDETIAGAVNGEGVLTVEVTRTGDSTTLRQIMRLVEEAQTSRSRFQALADRAAFWLTIIAIGAAVPTFLLWAAFGTGGVTFAVARAVTVLVIACPHALGLAIPLVTVNATSVSARNGILVRNREAFERGRSLATVAFDKTGTLTEGRFAVAGITAAEHGDDALAAAASLERVSEHPLAAAIVAEAERRGVTVDTATDVQAVPGHGIEGFVSGRRMRIGRPEWAESLGVMPDPKLEEALTEAGRRGDSAVVLMNDREVTAVIALRDVVRGSARAAVVDLLDMGVKPVMVTGDAREVAETVAGELGIAEFHARVLPADKERIVSELKLEGPTAFVGDGINDAPALLTADLGIAIGAGTNVAVESADLVLVDDDPADVVRAIRLSKATRTKMMQNLAWATGYNAVAIPLAAGALAWAGILLTPAVGALLMSMSTVIVALNAMTLRKVSLD